MLIANTPSFLLDRLRKDIAVQTVLDQMTAKEIVGALEEAINGAPKSANEMVSAYVYLVALSGADPQDVEIWKTISALDLSGLEWGDAIRSIILAEAIPTVSLEIPVCKKPNK